MTHTPARTDDARAQLRALAAQFRRMADKCIPDGEGAQAFMLCAENVEVAAAESPAPQGWQTIDTAPKDGRWVLVCDRAVISGDGITIARYDSDLDINAWYSGGAPFEEEEPLHPTHWMSLPTPPGGTDRSTRVSGEEE